MKTLRMLHLIVGTAGHVDHGKSALVKALTGIEPDRLEEEKRRGISIELGFAHLQLTPDLRLAFVDVPGHERFVRTMLAGAAGIDVVLFVIAADESIKPQTREHFDICRLLGIRHGVIALTKTDIAGSELTELVRLEIEDFVAGSFLQGAPVVAVSSKTGFGLQMLRDSLQLIASAVSPKSSAGPPRLPVDRSFSMKGHGTVVTGTLVSGTVSTGDELESYPGAVRARVRGIQVHGQPVNRAIAGQRSALNLAGAETDSIARGVSLSASGVFRASKLVDCTIDLLSSAKPLKHRAPVHFHAGTAEVEAEVRLLDRTGSLAPGESAFARLVLSQPLLLFPGDRFIIRMFSPVVTIGGGVVIETDPAKRKRAAVPERLAALRDADVAARVALLVRESGAGLRVADVAARTGELPARATELAGTRGLVQVQDWLSDPNWWRDTQRQIVELVGAFHRAQPLRPGMPKEELRAAILGRAPAFLWDALLAGMTEVTSEGEHVRLTSHSIRLGADEDRILTSIESSFRSAGLAAPTADTLLSKCGVELARARPLFQVLMRQGKLVRVSEELTLHREAVDSLRALLAAHRGERFGVTAFKDWTGLSRKHAIPLLEYLDRERVTRRVGEERVVLSTPSS